MVAFNSAKKIDSPIGIAVDAYDNVYFTDTTSTLKMIHIETNEISTVVSSELNDPSGLAIDASSGYIYIADYSSHSIKKYDPATATVSTLINTGLHFPTDVCLDNNNNIYIVDSSEHPIKVYNQNSKIMTYLEDKQQLIEKPGGIAYDESLNVLYVTDLVKNRLVRFNKQ